MFRVSGVADLTAAAAQHDVPCQQGRQLEQTAEATLPDSPPQAELEPTERQHPPPLAATASEEGLPGLPAASVAAQQEGPATADMVEQAAAAVAVSNVQCASSQAAAAWADSVQRQSQDAASENHPPCEPGLMQGVPA